MIVELTELSIKDGMTAYFESAVDQCEPIFRNAQGCLWMHLERVIGVSGSYFLRIGWETLEAHTIGFRESTGYQEWRTQVGKYFAKDPKVVHTEIASRIF